MSCDLCVGAGYGFDGEIWSVFVLSVISDPVIGFGMWVSVLQSNSLLSGGVW